MTKYELLKKMREEIDEFENEIESKYKDIEGNWYYGKYSFFKCAENVLSKLKEIKALKTTITSNSFDNKVIDFYDLTGEYKEEYKTLGLKV